MALGFMVWGFRVWGFRVWGFGVLGFRSSGYQQGLGAWDSECRRGLHLLLGRPKP